MAAIVKDLNQGSVVKTMLIFAMPLLGASLIQMLYNTADMIIVGKFVGKNGLGAVSVGGDVLHFLCFVAMGFANAGQVIISQYLGAGMKEKIGRIIGTLFTFLIVTALVLGSVTVIFRNQVLDWINTPPEVRGETEEYVVVCLAGLLFIFGYNVISAILRGMGDSKHPLIFVAIAAVLNVVLDIYFVVVCHWGVFGVALATVISQAVSFIFSIIFLWYHRDEFGFDFKPKSFLIDLEAVKPLLALGFPMLLQSASISFSMLFVNSFINSYGLIAAAMNGIGNKLGMVINIITFSLASAASPMIGQAIGARMYRRVPKILGVSLWINCLISLIIGIFIVIFPMWVFGIFTNDADVLDMALTYVPVMLVLLAGSALRPPLSALINGSGNFKLNLAVGILDGVLMRIGLSVLLGLTCGFGVYGFWYGHALAGLTPFFVGAVYFISGKWKTRKYIIKE
ncbi:MAG: MATE family efflux transporter [Lentisphaeria bacterium]|nr:MATE family efflux transporter [Lentisphaeria bacterium]